MHRRRFLTSGKKETWDDKWDFSQGLLEDSGFMKVEKIEGAYSEMTSLGELIKIQTNRGFYIAPKNYTTVSSGVVQVECIFKKFSSSTFSGFETRLSKGNKGIAFYVLNSGQSRFETSSKYILKDNLKENKIYKLRLELNNNGMNKCFLDDKLIKEDVNYKTSWCNDNIIALEENIEVIFRSIKYKYNRIEG